MKKSGGLNQIVGANIRRKREAQGLSQENFADKCRLHRTYIGAVERGERNITMVTLEKISTALGVDPRDLLLED